MGAAPLVGVTAPQQATVAPALIPSPAAPAPGWYADPAGSAQLRYWDGVDWTDHFSGG